jgi:hypothetical protein
MSIFPSLQLNRADVAPERFRRPCNCIDNESSMDEYDIDSDEHHEDEDGNDEPSSSGKQSRWSPEDDKRLCEWRKAGKSWNWICEQLPKRSHGAVKTHWYTKLRGEA